MDNKLVDIVKMADIIELYNYMPMHVKRNRNFSQELYYVFSSNTKGKPMIVKNNDSAEK